MIFDKLERREPRPTTWEPEPLELPLGPPAGDSRKDEPCTPAESDDDEVGGRYVIVIDLA
jgi:hypothetical protein